MTSANASDDTGTHFRDNKLNLSQIVKVFNSPIKEEHAWALCYQLAGFFADLLASERNADRQQTTASDSQTEQFNCLDDGAETGRRQRTKIATTTATMPPTMGKPFVHVFNVTKIEHIWLNVDGSINIATAYDSSNIKRIQFTNERKLVAGLGLVIFDALEIGYDSKEERSISKDLENLIDLMISVNDEDLKECCNHETEDDEGIERDSSEYDELDHQTNVSILNSDSSVTPSVSPSAPQPPEPQQTPASTAAAAAAALSSSSAKPPFSLKGVINYCSRVISPSKQRQQVVDGHYKAVCRALVAEAIELITFLEKVKSHEVRECFPNDSENLSHLKFTDWARFWVQVVSELRMGVKLKKVSSCCPNRTPIEYELTPYEILMDDIRSRRYKLKKIMIDGDIPPQVKKDAHAVILEFIRSRPPLKKVAERKLPPLKLLELTPREKLMLSIKKGQRLRPVRKSVTMSPTKTTNADVPVDQLDKIEVPEENSNQKTARLATLTTTASTSTTTTTTTTTTTIETKMVNDCGSGDDDENRTEPMTATSNRPSQKRRIKVDMKMIDMIANNEGDDDEDDKDDSRNRDAPLVFESIVDKLLQNRTSFKNYRAGAVSAARKTSVPLGAQQLSATTSANDDGSQTTRWSETATAVVTPDFSYSRNSEQLAQSNNWEESMTFGNQLSLTLDEIVHIRTVLTKAELEALPAGRVREDVEKCRVCFVCYKTKFGIFRNRGRKCRLCCRTVCIKCYTVMNIPDEHFFAVPVILLSPRFTRTESRAETATLNGGEPERLAETTSAKPETTTKTTTMVATAPDSFLGRFRYFNSSAPNSPRGSCGSSSGSSSSSSSCRQQRQQTSSFNLSTQNSSSFSSMLNLSDKNLLKSSGKTCKNGDMIVCVDCKQMVIEIIESSEKNRKAIRNNVIRNLTLNLQSVN